MQAQSRLQEHLSTLWILASEFEYELLVTMVLIPLYSRLPSVPPHSIPFSHSSALCVLLPAVGRAAARQRSNSSHQRGFRPPRHGSQTWLHSRASAKRFRKILKRIFTGILAGSLYEFCPSIRSDGAFGRRWLVQLGFNCRHCCSL